MKIRIYYEDTDAGGVVYHSNYLKFCERARSEIFFQNDTQIFDKDLGHFLLTKANCNFLKSAFLGDILEVKTHLVRLKKASMIIKQEIYKNEDKIFEAEFTLAFIKAGKVAIIEDKFIKILSAFIKD